MVLKMRNKRRFFVPGIVICLVICGTLVFCPAAEEKGAGAESIRRDVEQEALEESIRVFNTNDYKRAKTEFEMLSESAQIPEISRQALFGLATVKLALANTSDEYEDAISSWKKWSEQGNSCKGCEDPRMITPFLLRLQASIKGAAGAPSAISGKGRDVDFRGILQTKEKEMQTLRARLEQREREIRHLRHQLESLEEIHRKYEEKKQEANQ